MSTPLDDETIANGDVIETFHLTQLFPIVEALEDNQTNYREDIGVADAFKVDFSGSGQANEISAYQAGQQIVFKAAHANTGVSTLQVVGPSGALSAKALTKFGNAALAAGDIQANQLVMAVYNDEGSGRFEMVGAATDLPELPAPEDGSGFYRDDEGMADAYEVDASGGGDNPRPISALTKGMILTFKATQNNTGASTLEVIGPSGSLGAKAITKRGDALDADDIVADTMVAVLYSDEGSGRFELMGLPASGGGGGGENAWLYGDGSDGNVVIGSNEILFEHKFYNNLTVEEGVSLSTNGFKVYVRGTLVNDGVIHANGEDGTAASGATPGTSGSSGNYDLVAWQGHWGGAGSLQSGETVYTEDQRVFFARGGDGGAGDYGAGGSGEGGNTFIGERYFKTLTAYLSGVSDYYTYDNNLRVIAAGMGGGGGTGNDDDAAGGGGGGSGGVLWIAARHAEGLGTLESRGGNGGDADSTDAGGGGGGGGGIIYLLTNETINPFTCDVSGGTGGLGGGGVGGDGGNGETGLIVFLGGL